MRGLQIVIVVRPIHVRRHGADEIAAVLPPIRLAQFDARDFGDGIPLVRRLQFAGEKKFLLQRLRCELGINAGTAEEQKFFNARQLRGVDQIVLNLEIFKKKFRRLRAVRVDAADLGRRDENKFRLCLRKKFLHGGGVQQIDFLLSPANEVFETLPLKFAPDGAAHQSVVSGHINARIFVHQHGRILRGDCRRVNSKRALTPAPLI